MLADRLLKASQEPIENPIVRSQVSLLKENYDAKTCKDRINERLAECRLLYSMLPAPHIVSKNLFKSLSEDVDLH